MKQYRLNRIRNNHWTKELFSLCITELRDAKRKEKALEEIMKIPGLGTTVNYELPQKRSD